MDDRREFEKFQEDLKAKRQTRRMIGVNRDGGSSLEDVSVENSVFLTQ